MPAAEYEHRTDSVLAWKKAQKLGRFDPDAPSIEQQKIRASEREVEERGKPYDFPHVPPTVEPYVCGNGHTGARSSTWITARLLCHDCSNVQTGDASNTSQNGYLHTSNATVAMMATSPHHSRIRHVSACHHRPTRKSARQATNLPYQLSSCQIPPT
jgi:hypothetical protein